MLPSFLSLQVLMEVMDIRNRLINAVYPMNGVCADAEAWAAKRDDILGNSLPGTYAKLEAAIQKFPGVFVCGDKPGASDFHLWGALRLQQGPQPAPCSDRPPLPPSLRADSFISLIDASLSACLQR